MFSSFTSMLDLIETELKKYHFRFLKLTGSDTKENRYRKVKEFQNGDIDVFLISLTTVCWDFERSCKENCNIVA